MKDFFTFDLKCKLSKQQVLDIVSINLPDFKWRQGDSDAQGPYLSGLNSNEVRTQIWMGEYPMDMFVSFRSGGWSALPDSEERKNAIIQKILSVIALLEDESKKLDTQPAMVLANQMVEMFRANGVPEHFYAVGIVDGGECYGIEFENGKWNLFYSEHGERKVLDTFASEQDSCLALTAHINQMMVSDFGRPLDVSRR